MKNVALVVLALGMLACNNNNRPSLVDSGMITLGDSGMPGHDTGPAMGHDSGSGGGTCGAIGTGATFPPLPASCLPRCMGATVTAYNACVTTYQASGMTPADQMTLQTCTSTALMADHTATVQVDAGGGQTIPISCGGDATMTFSCLDWQGLAAESMFCDTELAAYLMCVQALPAGTTGMAGCPSEYSARATCNNTHMTDIQGALNTLGSMCFGG